MAGRRLDSIAERLEALRPAQSVFVIGHDRSRATTLRRRFPDREFTTESREGGYILTRTK